MENPRVALQKIGKEDIIPVGYKEIACHIIFDLKMDITRIFLYFWWTS